jgi:hypothetical protein
MTTIVGIFDNAWDLEKAVERLARAGFEDTVYDEASVSGEPGGTAGPAVFAPGYGPPVAWGSGAEPGWRPKPVHHAQHTIVEAFKAHLADYHLPAEAIDAYAVNFNHNGEFILVKTKPERAAEAMEILRGCGASKVDRHG